MNQNPFNKTYAVRCEFEYIKEAKQYGKSALPLPSF